MILRLIYFEVKNRLWRSSSLVYFLVYLSLAYLLSITFAGAFKGAAVSFGLSNKLALNSPIVLNNLISLLGYVALLTAAPIFGQSIHKDFENGFYQILFTTPIRRRTYFSVRFVGSFISMVIVASSFMIGIWLATLMPFADRTLISENHFYFYLAPYLTNVLPNLFIFGALFIAVASYAKRMVPVYVASIAIFTGWLISQSLTTDLDNKFIAAMIDPLGLEAATQVVRYWSVVEQSTRVIPLEGPFLLNRILWSIVGVFLLGFGYLVFTPEPRKSGKDRGASSGGEIPVVGVSARPSEHRPGSWQVWWGLSRSEFLQAFANVFFLIILLCGVLYIFAASTQVGKIMGTETLPVTYHVVELIGGTFSLFMVILITFYAGELVWKDREQAFYELVDSTPVSNAFLYLSKLNALILLQLVLAVTVLICCVLIQIFKGYFHFEWGVYFGHLFFYGLPARIYLCVLALFVQTAMGNKYLGHSVVILYYIALLWVPSVGLDHVLYLVGQIPRWSYSDMNGFGQGGEAFATVGLYWGFFYTALAILTVLLWRRGVAPEAGNRRTEFRRQLGRRSFFGLGLCSIGFLVTGGFIFYNTNILNEYKSKMTLERERVDYEKAYKKYALVEQPQVTAVNLEVDIYPEVQGVIERGLLRLTNQSTQPLESIFVNLSKTAILRKLDWDRPTELAESQVSLGVRIFRLTPPLKPGEIINLNFEVEVKRSGFVNGEPPKKLLENGTFFYGGDFGPTIGYNPGFEVEEEKTRRKYALPERLRMPDINDRRELNKTYLSNEGTWIDFAATVSTSLDQYAVAPGYLVREWVVDGRRYFQYKMDRPILDFYAFLSARYEVARDEWQGVKLEVYHHPSHTRNVPRMMNSMKKSLAYYTKEFSPYQFHQLRIFEFPRYAGFAQSFPNTIPFSEGIGFIARVNDKDPESIDYPFWVTAHEVAHQWWGHQVIGGNVQGSTMLCESLAEYSSLMVQEHEYGAAQMRKFLKYALDRYLMGRSREAKRELPLALDEGQPYIHYEKGALVFYALKDYLGESVVNGVLRQYIRDMAYQNAPFTRSVDLVERFRKVTPPELKYLIDDLFEEITLYDNRAVSASVKDLGGSYEVTLEADVKKVHADGLGKETEVSMNDFIDVGVFNAKGELLDLKKTKVHSGLNRFKIRVNQRPVKAGIDPLNKLIDRVPDDNLILISVEK